MRGSVRSVSRLWAHALAQHHMFGPCAVPETLSRKITNGSLRLRHTNLPLRHVCVTDAHLLYNLPFPRKIEAVSLVSRSDDPKRLRKHAVHARGNFSQLTNVTELHLSAATEDLRELPMDTWSHGLTHLVIGTAVNGSGMERLLCFSSLRELSVETDCIEHLSQMLNLTHFNLAVPTRSLRGITWPSKLQRLCVSAQSMDMDALVSQCKELTELMLNVPDVDVTRAPVVPTLCLFHVEPMLLENAVRLSLCEWSEEFLPHLRRCRHLVDLEVFTHAPQPELQLDAHIKVAWGQPESHIWDLHFRAGAGDPTRL